MRGDRGVMGSQSRPAVPGCEAKAHGALAAARIAVRFLPLALPLAVAFAYRSYMWHIVPFEGFRVGFYGASVAMAACTLERRLPTRLASAFAVGLFMCVPFFSRTFDVVVLFAVVVASALVAAGGVFESSGISAFKMLREICYRSARVTIGVAVFMIVLALPLARNAELGLGILKSPWAFAGITYAVIAALVVFDALVKWRVDRSVS